LSTKYLYDEMVKDVQEIAMKKAREDAARKK